MSNRYKGQEKDHLEEREEDKEELKGSDRENGHVFVIFGSLPKIACDAWVFPTNADVEIDKLAKWTDTSIDAFEEFGFVNVFPRKEWGENGRRAYKVSNWRKIHPYLPQPWVCLTGKKFGEAAPVEWYIHAIKQFFEAVHKDLKNVAPLHNRERHLICVPLVGAGAGGGKSISDEIMKALFDELFAAATKYKFDVALVTNKERIHAAALSLRNQYKKTFSALSPKLKKKGDKLASYALKGKLVVFIGGGCSAAAGMPQWGELINELEEEAVIVGEEKKFACQLSYLDRAEFIEKRFMRKGKNLQDAISAKMNRNMHAVSHAMLATLPTYEYVTTNYDTLFELANMAVFDKIRVLPYEHEAVIESPLQQKTKSMSRGKWLLKLHGCIKHKDDIVLTREHYLRFHERKQALTGIVQALLITKHMLFVGYSLADDHFFNIASTVRKAMRSEYQMKEKPIPFGTTLSLTNNPVIKELWEDDIKMIPMDISDTKVGARKLEIFLDYICTKSLSPVNHLFDPNYHNILSAGDRTFRDAFLKFLHQDFDNEVYQSASFLTFRQEMIKIFKSEDIFIKEKRAEIMSRIMKKYSKNNQRDETSKSSSP